MSSYRFPFEYLWLHPMDNVLRDCRELIFVKNYSIVFNILFTKNHHKLYVFFSTLLLKRQSNVFFQNNTRYEF